jgi:hypothetical protein
VSWSWANIDWNGTGAMVQAIGSVLAIGAAIWIDQGAARRLREDRALAFEEARRARVEAVVRAGNAIRELADAIEPSKATTHMLSKGEMRRIENAREVLAFYLRQTGTECDGRIIAALVDAEARTAAAIAAFDFEGGILATFAAGGSVSFDEKERADIVGKLRQLAKAPEL